MRLNAGLEDEHRCRSFCVRSHFLTVFGLWFRSISYAWSHLAEELHQTTATHIFHAASAHNRIYTCLCKYDFQTAHGLFLAQCTLFEEFLHQRFVSFCCHLVQCTEQLFYLTCLRCRNIFQLRSATFGFPHEHLAFQHVNNGVETATCVNRILHQTNFVTKVLFQGFERTLEVRILVVALVDDESHRLLGVLCQTEAVLCTYFHAAVSCQHDSCCVHNVQCRYSTAAEVVRTRAIDDVQLLAAELDVTNCREYRIAVLLLYWEIVAYRRLCFNRAATFNHSALKEH